MPRALDRGASFRINKFWQSAFPHRSVSGRLCSWLWLPFFFAHALGPQRDENRLNPPGIQMRQQLWSTDYDLSVQNFVIRDEVLVGTLKAKAPVRHPAFANDQKEGGNLHIRVVIPLHRVNRLDLERIVRKCFS